METTPVALQKTRPALTGDVAGAIGLVMLFAGLYMAWRPLAFIVVGILLLGLSYLSWARSDG